MRNKILFLALIGLLMSCATTAVFDTSKVDRSLTPQRVVAEPELSLNKVALWGGTILDTRNLKDSTQIEVLAYPLSSSHRPLLDSKPLGRFILQHQEYLEPANYAQGRLLTVLGSVIKSQSGKIGESSYLYPVINAQQLQLWPTPAEQNRTSFQFGLGIRL